jgi:hypothetical protein
MQLLALPVGYMAVVKGNEILEIIDESNNRIV